MGGKSGGGAKTPYEAPNTLDTAQRLLIVDAICEGEVAGFANGDDHPLKSVFLNDTPIQNPDGSYNFKGISAYFLKGTGEQPYIPGFDTVQRTVAVGAEVKKNTQIVRAVTDEQVSRLRITVGVERNARVTDDGDTLPSETRLKIELVNSGGVQVSRDVLFREKSSGVAYQDVLIERLPDAPFNIRVSRITADSGSDRVQDKTYLSSYVEITDAKLSYPHTAMAALRIDSDQFGSHVPRRNYLLKGKLVAVPSHYNPETRRYAGGTWDGTFKLAWTDNPAWIYYDLLTQIRYSTLARRINVQDIDKWTLYRIARYCDEQVPDGFGGQEPRFVCNAYLADLSDAKAVLDSLASVFRGMPVWDGLSASVVLDDNPDPVALYTNSNVVDGRFTRQSAASKSIHTAVYVKYLDKHDSYRAKIEYLHDAEAVKKYGLNIKQVEAFGCTSRGQAARTGAWILQTELRQQHAISFEVGRDGLRHLPGDVVTVADNRHAGAQIGGRVVSVSGNVVTLDRDVVAQAGHLFYYVAQENGTVKMRTVNVAAQTAPNKLRLAQALPLEPMAVWALAGAVKPQLYRCMGIQETDKGTYAVTALLHDPEKYSRVDRWADFKAPAAQHGAPKVVNPSLSVSADGYTLGWDSAASDTVVYDVKLYKGTNRDAVYRHIPDSAEQKVKFTGLGAGDYTVIVRGKNSRGVYSEPLSYGFSIRYQATALKTVPMLNAVGVSWTLPETLPFGAYTELWYGKSNRLDQAQKLVSLPYPQSSYVLNNVSVGDRYWFWLRVADADGNSGEYTAAVPGQSDTDPTALLKQLQGKIGETEIKPSVIDTFNAKTDAARLAAEAKAVELHGQAAAQIVGLRNEIGSLQAGGRNLLKKSGKAVSNNAYLMAKYAYADKLAEGEDAVITIWGSLGADRANFRLCNSNSYVHLGDAQKIADGVYQWRGKWRIAHSNPALSAANHELFVYQYRSTGKSESAINKIKLERGTIASDWTAAPEETGGADEQLRADFEEYRQTQTENQTALTQQINQAKAEAGEAKAQVAQTAQSYARLNGRVDAMYAVKVETVNGGKKAVAGFMLSSGGGQSDFDVLAEKFRIWHPSAASGIAPFVFQAGAGGGKLLINGDLIGTGAILGRHIAANQTIQSPVIRSGKIEIGGFKVSAAGLEANKDQPGKISVTDNLITMRDENGRVWLALGNLVSFGVD